ncbi:MAG: hypothetical protein FJX72_19775, partial [Armatimonadetes bacterium]|nr:hypothetical protein [Armatimonadota bacterium]
MRLSGTRRSVGRARRIGAAMAGVFLCVMGVTMRAHDTGGRAVADTKSVGPPLAAALPRAPQPVGSKQPTDRVHPVASVFRAFATPPRSYSPVPIWWWSGERLDVRRLEWQMDRMVEGHVYNTVILNLAPSGPLYGSAPDSPPFFSEGWWRILRRVLTKAKALGLRVWLYDQLGFSTARIQERLMERTPAWRAAELAVLQQDVTGPTTVRMAAPGRGLSASAVPIGGDGQPTGAAVSLATSLRDGRLNKQMPSGRYRVMLFYEAQGGFDYMSPVAAGKLLNYVHGEFERKLKPYFGNTIPG